MKAVFTDDKNRVLNVRETVDGEVLEAVPSGTEFEIEAIENGWAQVKSPIEGYVMAEYLTIDEEPADDEATEEPEAENIDEEPTELDKMKLPELKKLAKESGIEIPNGAKKEDVINAILNA